jgi:thymidylate synthase
LARIERLLFKVKNISFFLNIIPMKNIEEQYLDLLKDILENGVKKTDRTGTGTLSVFGRQIRHKMSDGFPLLTTKKMAWKAMVTELIWFLQGETNIRYLVENGCNIWNGDAYKKYSIISGMSTQVQSLSKEEFADKIKNDVDFAKKWGELGPVYGKQWRNWENYEDTGQHFSSTTQKIEQSDILRKKPIDQIEQAIHKLKTNPDDRGIIVSAWNVSDLDDMVLRPCHNFFQFYTRELSLEERADIWNKTHNPSGNIYTHNQYDENNIPTRAISLSFNMRSCDVPLGLPFNIASYALLLEIFGKMLNMVPDELIGNLGDTHIYLNQVEGAKEQITREPMEFPKLVHLKTEAFYDSLSNDLTLFGHLDKEDFTVEGYKSHPKIEYPLSN